MDVDGRGEDGVEFGEGGEVVHMAVGQQIGHDVGAEFAQAGGELGAVVAGIDHHRPARGGVGGEITIFF